MAEQTDIIYNILEMIVIIVGFVKQRRLFNKNSAKQSILQMIMEDQFNFEQFGKLPVNYSNIELEYGIYHKNGGNGEITKRVQEYRAWREGIEEKIIERKKHVKRS